jgi:hypothetical protein
MNNLALVDKEYKSILEKRGMLSNEMGSEISESWARCISNGLDPFKGPKKSVISVQQLDQIREKKRFKENSYSRVGTFVFSSCWYKLYGSLF